MDFGLRSKIFGRWIENILTKTLLLVPTEFEATKLRPHLSRDREIFSRCVIERCGFGLIESAVRTSQQLAKRPIERIILIGIAGVYSQFSEHVGTATIVHSVVQYGIGSMKNGSFLTPPQLGFSSNAPEEIRLHTQTNSTNQEETARRIQLVSVSCAGQLPEDEILTKYPHASCEDMEGYSVAYVASEHQIPLTIIRGFSNVVGEEFANWKVDHAIESASKILKQVI